MVQIATFAAAPGSLLPLSRLSECLMKWLHSLLRWGTFGNNYFWIKDSLPRGTSSGRIVGWYRTKCCLLGVLIILNRLTCCQRSVLFEALNSVALANMCAHGIASHSILRQPQMTPLTEEPSNEHSTKSVRLLSLFLHLLTRLNTAQSHILLTAPQSRMHMIFI
jgi:hypothetical protein